jgi:dipeptidase E
MKFFLSSIRLPNSDEQAKLFGNKTHISVAIIPNAWDTYPEDRQKVELADALSQFKDIGFKTTVIDLVTDSNISEKVIYNNFLWVMGGNTFYLNYIFHKTGFDKILIDALSKGVVYGGSSAGAVIVTPTLHGVENVDDPKDAPQVIWDGLGLVDFGVVPHWGMAKYAKELEKMKQDMEPHVPLIVTLNNEQAVIEIDGKREVG